MNIAPKKTGRRPGKGSHGSLVKAGKVRYRMTTKVERSTKRKSNSPRINNRLKYERRVLRDIPSGQPQIGRPQ